MLNIGPGDEVITTPMTFAASVNVIEHVGATPVLVDVEPDTLNLQPDAVERAITPNTKAVIAVHYAGHPVELHALRSICDEYGLHLIEDAAHAIGAAFDGQPIGSGSNLTAFSFYATKNLTTGEGGMVVTNDAGLYEKAYRLKTQGVSPHREYWHEVIGYNYRMTNVCAAIGLAQLEQADHILSRKRQVVRWYEQHLRNLPLKTQLVQKNTEHSWWMYSVLLETEHLRNDLWEFLKAAKIETRPLFPPIHRLPPYNRGAVFPIAENLSGRGVTLPSYPELSEDDVAMISEKIGNFFDRRS